MDERPPPRPDDGSFRDPASRVYIDGDRVLRGLSAEGEKAFEAVSRSAFFTKALDAGEIVPTTRLAEVPEAICRDGWIASLEHPRLPVWTYPYEWSFSMLQDAATLQLELLLGALAADFSCKDATPFNIQFDGVRPLFVDVGSFEVFEPGEPWYGYLQFCQMYLYPLLLQTYADLAFQPWLRSQVDGITPEQTSKVLGLHRLPKRGVAVHVALHVQARRRLADTDADVRGAMKRSGFSKAMIEANVRGLLRLVQGLRWRRVESAWSDYSDRSHYSDGDLAQKEDFVRGVVAARHHEIVWDIGCNDGRFSRLVAGEVGRVVAFDADDLVVDLLYRSLRRDDVPNVVPLVVDFANPSPGLGWRGRERAPFLERNRADLVLALAFIHHLAITHNVPPERFLDVLVELGAESVIEFPTETDPLVRKLLRNKRPGAHPEYNLVRFEELLADRFTVQSRVELGSGSRVLFHVVPRV